LVSLKFIFYAFGGIRSSKEGILLGFKNKII
jgi:hypothetical protein